LSAQGDDTAAVFRDAVRGAIGSVVVAPVVALLWGAPWDVPGGVDPRWLIVPLWAALAALAVAARSSGPLAASGRRGLRVWRAADPLLGAVFVQAVLFRAPESFFVPAAIFALLAAAIHGLQRASGPVLVAVASIFVLLGVVAPRVFEAAVLARVSATYALDVDHRLHPDGGEINSDGARFRGEAEDLADDDFVVLFLGDSFTFGFGLAYADSYPYRVEALAGEYGCAADVRVVNMGWTSASPLLALRLLRQVGYRYRPDLVVYSLDMTDFHDDLRYEWRLREQLDYEFDAAAVAERWIAREWPWASPLRPVVRAVTSRLRAVDRDSRAELLEGLRVPRPDERYFVTSRPLEQTRPAIELGVMKNLGEMERLSQDVLGARMALVVYPRAYQYSDREVPRNWEKGYTPLGRYVREPFRYFAEVGDSLAYPVIDVLADFESSERFPLYFGNDPHWTEQGADVAARAVFTGLRERGLLPCAS